MIKKLAKRKRSTSESLEIFAMLPERGGAPLPKPLKPTTSLHTDESLQLLPPKTLELPSTLQSFLRLNIIKAVRAVRAVRKDRLLNKYPEQHCYVIAVKDSPICYQRLTADTWDMAGKWNDAPFLTKHGAISQMTTMDNHPLFQRMVIIRQTELRDLQERFAIDVITKCFPYRNHPKP